MTGLRERLASTGAQDQILPAKSPGEHSLEMGSCK